MSNIITTFLNFSSQRGYPSILDHFDDLKAPEVKPCARMGGWGAYVNLFGEETSGDNSVCEIPPGQSLKPQRPLFEELVYVLSGRGVTTYWTREGGPKMTFAAELQKRGLQPKMDSMYQAEQAELPHLPAASG